MRRSWRPRRAGKGQTPPVNKCPHPGSIPTHPVCGEGNERDITNSGFNPALQPGSPCSRRCLQQKLLFIFFFLFAPITSSWAGKYGRFLSLWGAKFLGFGAGFAQHRRPGPAPLHCAAQPGSSRDKGPLSSAGPRRCCWNINNDPHPRALSPSQAFLQPRGFS